MININAKMPAAEDFFKSDSQGLSTAGVHYLGNLEKLVRALPDEFDGREELGVMRGINTQTANYTLVAGDKGKTVESNSASDLVFTFDANVFETNDWGNIARIGTGALTIDDNSGAVTILSSLNRLTLANQYSLATWYCRAPNVIVLGGDIV